MYMYADDTNIYLNLEDFDHLTKEIDRKLGKVNNYLKPNKLSLNTQKSKTLKSVLFHREQKLFDKISVVINGIDRICSII